MLYKAGVGWGGGGGGGGVKGGGGGRKKKNIVGSSVNMSKSVRWK